MENYKIWFDKPAAAWEETHPIGNGRLGAMIWGTIEEERLGLNLDTLWSGYERDTNNYHAYEHLAETRDEIFHGHYVKAAKMVEDYLLSEFGESYLPMGTLYIGVRSDSQAAVDNYTRTLSLDDSVVTISYEMQNIHYTREYFASYPDQLLGIRYTAGTKTDFQIRLESELQPVITPQYHVDNLGKSRELCGLRLQGQCPEHVEPSYLQSDDPIIWGERGLRFETLVEILDTDGTCIWEKCNQALIITDATYVELTVRAASGTREQPQVIAYAHNIECNDFAQLQTNYEQLREKHFKDYRRLFRSVEFELDDDCENELAHLPMDERLRRIGVGTSDLGIYPLFFQYGRYLLISSSREGSEAANLQGIWNWEMRAPWSSNYTTNINVEMNYWPAQVCGLNDCMEPYYRLLRELVTNGKRTARVHFGCRGFCVGHNTDFWRFTNPVGIPFGEKSGVAGSSLYSFFVLSGQWMCQELWKAYEYHRDLKFLEQLAFPILREAALFAVDWLVEYEGYYVTCPSASPENQFQTEEGISPISMGTTMDLTIIREIFDEYEQAYEELGKACQSGRCHCSDIRETELLFAEEGDPTDEELLRLIDDRRSKLAPYKIAGDGRLQEWYHPFQETEPGHRHISHVYGLFPGREFRNNLPLKEACRKTIDYRLAHGGGHTGWSCVWIANLYAMLGDGEKAYEFMKSLMEKALCPNLWTLHPPFQIDANFGGTMAIANMLVQEQDGEVLVLPAIPQAWNQGRVKGLRLSNNRCIDIAWKGEEVHYEIYKSNS